MFRALTCDEIEVRVAEGTINGVSLLLYKNARCDMQILDETVTPFKWQREHYECKGNLFCKVGILGEDGWIWKSDAGSESTYEKQKGEASDSFKRACTNWGIGRELYTAPRIWVPSKACKITQSKNGKFTSYDRFSVEKIIIENHKIKALAIKNESHGNVCFVWQLKEKEEGK